jgi:hypothetical protein
VERAIKEWKKQARRGWKKAVEEAAISQIGQGGRKKIDLVFGILS